MLLKRCYLINASIYNNGYIILHGYGYCSELFIERFGLEVLLQLHLYIQAKLQGSACLSHVGAAAAALHLAHHSFHFLCVSVAEEGSRVRNVL